MIPPASPRGAERDLLRAVDGLPVAGLAEGPAAEEYSALLFHAVGLGFWADFTITTSGFKSSVHTGVFRAGFSLCPCWRLLRSSATVFSRWLHSVTFLKGEAAKREGPVCHRIVSKRKT
jgi:hypothetical protein